MYHQEKQFYLLDIFYTDDTLIFTLQAAASHCVTRWGRYSKSKLMNPTFSIKASFTSAFVTHEIEATSNISTWYQSKDGFVYRPTISWCFLSNITQEVKKSDKDSVSFVGNIRSDVYML